MNDTFTYTLYSDTGEVTKYVYVLVCNLPILLRLLKGKKVTQW